MTSPARLGWMPNAVSAARLLLGLAVPLLPERWRFAAVLVAAASDVLDGVLARRLRAETPAGRLLDPLADRVFVTVALGTLAAAGLLHPMWAVLVAARDIAVLVGTAAFLLGGGTAGLGRLRPTRLGKVTTTAQFGLLLLLAGTGQPWPVLVAAVAVVSGAAAVGYARWGGERPA